MIIVKLDIEVSEVMSILHFYITIVESTLIVDHY